MSKPKYDCSRCPGYCCSYPVIQVTTAPFAIVAVPKTDREVVFTECDGDPGTYFPTDR